MIAAALLALLPLAVLVLGMTVLNWPTWRAALPALAVLAAITALNGPAGLDGTVGSTVGSIVGAPAEVPWGRALADALLLTGIVGYTLFFGLLLHELTARSGALDVLLEGMRGLGSDGVARLMWVLLVFGPLFESISGFGLGVMVAVPMLLALGYSTTQTLALSLMSQLAVPWGALAIGMTLGAQMAALPLPLVGAATAVLALPAYAACWGTALRLGRPPGGWGAAALARSWAGLAVFALGVWAANRWATPELGGLGGAGLLAVWLLALQGRAVGSHPAALATPPRRRVLAAAAPYAVLVGLLGVTRFVPALQGWLATHAVLSLPGAAFRLPLLYNPGAALAVACLVAALAFRSGRDAPARLGAALWAALGRWSVAAGAVLLLALLARGMVEAGHIAALSTAGSALPSGAARAAMAVLALLGGFLTGSVAGANALFMDLQVRMAAGLALPGLWPVALHQVLTAGATAFSPARLVFAAIMTGERGQEGAVLRRLAPLALLLLAIGIAALHPALLAVLERLRPLLVGEAAG